MASVLYSLPISPPIPFCPPGRGSLAADQSYVHRIGRCGRAGHKGTAISFFTSKNSKSTRELIRILKQANQKVGERTEHGIVLPRLCWSLLLFLRCFFFVVCQRSLALYPMCVCEFKNLQYPGFHAQTCLGVQQHELYVSYVCGAAGGACRVLFFLPGDRIPPPREVQ